MCRGYQQLVSVFSEPLQLASSLSCRHWLVETKGLKLSPLQLKMAVGRAATPAASAPTPTSASFADSAIAPAATLETNKIGELQGFQGFVLPLISTCPAAPAGALLTESPPCGVHDMLQAGRCRLCKAACRQKCMWSASMLWRPVPPLPALRLAAAEMAGR